MKKGKATRAIHGELHDESYLSAVYPIYQTSTFGVAQSDEYQSRWEEEDFYVYTRLSNPTIHNVEKKLAALENAEEGLLFSSGMAAITSTILSIVRAGDTVVAPRPLYGGSYTFIRDTLPKLGVKTVLLDGDTIHDVDKHAPDARLVYLETPINPTCRCLDLAAIVQAARRIGAVTVVDNTFASPINQNPIDFGVDIVVHSVTKYIGGHSDVIAGAALTSKQYIEGLRESLKTYGGCLSPLEAFLLDRSLKTLKMRVEAHNVSAQKLAHFFADEPKVQRVHYPGLPDSPDHAIAKAQMRGYGGMMMIELANPEAAKTFCDSVTVALNAVSLGSVETLVSIPYISTHGHLDEDELRGRITPNMVRVSIGLEDVDDLIADFKQALVKIGV